MRQFTDTLVWLALVVVVVAVLYFTPLVASYVSSREGEAVAEHRGGVAWRLTAHSARVAPAGLR
jgi:hypothetical protein